MDDYFEQRSVLKKPQCIDPRMCSRTLLGHGMEHSISVFSRWQLCYAILSLLVLTCAQILMVLFTFQRQNSHCIQLVHLSKRWKFWRTLRYTRFHQPAAGLPAGCCNVGEGKGEGRQDVRLLSSVLRHLFPCGLRCPNTDYLARSAHGCIRRWRWRRRPPRL